MVPRLLRPSGRAMMHDGIISLLRAYSPAALRALGEAVDLDMSVRFLPVGVRLLNGVVYRRTRRETNGTTHVAVHADWQDSSSLGIDSSGVENWVPRSLHGSLIQARASAACAIGSGAAFNKQRRRFREHLGVPR